MPASNYTEKLMSTGGAEAKQVAAGTVSVLAKTGPGRLCRVICLAVSTTGTTFYDNTAASGTKLYITKAALAVGDVIELQVPFVVGLFIDQGAGGGQLVVAFT